MPTQIVTGGTNGVLAAETAGDTMNGPLTLANQASAPVTPTGAAVLYSSGGVLTYVNPQGLVNTMVGSQGGIQTAGIVTVNTTASETVVQSMSLPANDAIPGAVYKMVGWGTYGTTGSTPTLAWGARLGGVAGTSLTTIPAITTLAGATTSVPWKYEILLNFLSATTAQCLFELDFGTVLATGATSVFTGTPSAATTVSLTATKAFVSTITWSASSASNTLSLLGGWSERVA